MEEFPLGKDKENVLLFQERVSEACRIANMVILN